MVVRFIQRIDGAILDGFQTITEKIEYGTGINTFTLTRGAFYLFLGTLAFTLIFDLKWIIGSVLVLAPLGLVVQLALQQIARTEQSTRRGMLNIGPHLQTTRIVLMVILIATMLFGSPSKSFHLVFTLAVLILYLTSCTPLPPGSTGSRQVPQGAA